MIKILTNGRQGERERKRRERRKREGEGDATAEARGKERRKECRREVEARHGESDGREVLRFVGLIYIVADRIHSNGKIHTADFS